MLVIIPARGGSKGLPGKNLRLLCGRPLIEHTIEAALSAKGVERVVFSTESQELADVAVKAGAEVPFLRPPELATDTSLIIDTYLYTIDRLNEGKIKYDTMIALLPTAPLRTGADIDAAIHIFQKNEADSVVSMYKAPHPLRWHMLLEANGTLRPAQADSGKLANRQEDPQAYLPNGAIYIFRREILTRRRTYYTERTFPYIMPKERSVDIDFIEDFEYAEYLFKKRDAAKLPRGCDGPALSI